MLLKPFFMEKKPRKFIQAKFKDEPINHEITILQCNN